MSPLNWDFFCNLPGDVTDNFERLCKSAIRYAYGKYGTIKGLANQPGVEFYLNIASPCSLGNVGQCFGWQCRWYGLSSGQSIGTTRKNKIIEAIDKTVDCVVGITDWVLWTRYHLTKSDQKWYYSLQDNYNFRLHLWTIDEVEALLAGEAAILRSTYFGELVVTPEVLAERFTQALATVKNRWVPDVYQTTEPELQIAKYLGAIDAWPELASIIQKLERWQGVIAKDVSGNADLEKKIVPFVDEAKYLAKELTQLRKFLALGAYEAIRDTDILETRYKTLRDILNRLRATRQALALPATNLFAAFQSAWQHVAALKEMVSRQLVVIVGEAGDGKTMLSINLAQPQTDRPAGVLLLGRDLSAIQNLDDLAQRISIAGRPVPSFEALLAAVDAAAQRAKRRLPILIDGLHEAEDPRKWKSLLAAVSCILPKYPNILLVCTIRPSFLEEALPMDLEQIHLDGFGEHTIEAVERYFSYYKIKLSDIPFEIGILEHPLTLRIFCEVTNPNRTTSIEIDELPASKTMLFGKFIQQSGERIAELSSHTHRYYEPDVRNALSSVAYFLWENNARSISMKNIRQLLGDANVPWDKSIVRALQDEGILLGDFEFASRGKEYVFIYDELAGYLIADALFDAHSDNFFVWINEEINLRKIQGGYQERHPLAADIFHSLIGLTPERMYRKQLWKEITPSLQKQALTEACLLDKKYLDEETALELEKLCKEKNQYSTRVLRRLFIVHSSTQHPLNAIYLDKILRTLTISERDLLWSEWVRRWASEQQEVLERLIIRWQNDRYHRNQDILRALWIRWLLTSTNRPLRDLATKALVCFGRNDPTTLFDMAIGALEINDPYVPERMLAASYGVCLSIFNTPGYSALAEIIGRFAKKLAESFFYPGASYKTSHELIRGYALWIINIAMLCNKDLFSEQCIKYFKPPFAFLHSNFIKFSEINTDEIEDAKNALRMDFRNYTIGRLIKNRRNYDDDHHEYKVILAQIKHRILQLGYNSTAFKGIDADIAEASWRGRENNPKKVDRYGKKYSWIAYYEMYGLQKNRGAISTWREEERISDIDIDPSFPEEPKSWKPELNPIFTSTAKNLSNWVLKGPRPDYLHLLTRDNVDNLAGPWVLLEGYVNQESETDDREIFTFLRGILIHNNLRERLLDNFRRIEYPGNSAIPEPREDHYSFAGELINGLCFEGNIRIGENRFKPDMRVAFERTFEDDSIKKCPVEIPVCQFSWEHYHSMLNQTGGATVINPALLKTLKLHGKSGEWDLYDSTEHIASIYRKFREQGSDVVELHYIRADLLREYLEQKNKSLVFMVWGERGIHYRSNMNMEKIYDKLSTGHPHIHKYCGVWDAESNSITSTGT